MKLLKRKLSRKSYLKFADKTHWLCPSRQLGTVPNTKAPPDIYGQKALPHLKGEFQSLTQEHWTSHGTPHGGHNNTPELPGQSSSWLQSGHREVTPRPQTYMNKPLHTSPSPWGPIFTSAFPRTLNVFPSISLQGQELSRVFIFKDEFRRTKTTCFQCVILMNRPNKVSMEKHRLLFITIYLPINTQRITPETRSLPPLKPSGDTAHLRVLIPTHYRCS